MRLIKLLPTGKDSVLLNVCDVFIDQKFLKGFQEDLRATNRKMPALSFEVGAHKRG